MSNANETDDAPEIVGSLNRGEGMDVTKETHFAAESFSMACLCLFVCVVGAVDGLSEGVHVCF